jgi:hypothetical protein
MNAERPEAFPDPEESRAVLIGSSTYTALPPLASVRNNLGGLAASLRDPGVWGLREDRCDVVANPPSATQLIEPIIAAAEDAADTLLVYYAGHGLTDRSGDLYLTVADSKANAQYTQVPYQWVRDPIRESPARRRIVILDCCYSGRAANEMMGGDTPYAAQADVDGSFILTATPENREALAPANQQYTAFTQELIAVLSEGLIGGDELLNLNDIFRHVAARLKSSSRPTPQARDRNNLGSYTSFRNKAFVAGAARIDNSPEVRDAESQRAMRRLRTVCLRASADFLRREALREHDQLYVPREIDAAIHAVIGRLGPVNLRRVHRLAKRRSGEVGSEFVVRAPPPQIIVVSDDPGTGKSMLGVQLTRPNAPCAAVVRPATASVADDLRDVLAELGPDGGLMQLLLARVPLVYVIDGLDKADHSTDQKHIIDLFKLIGRLNDDAWSQGMRAFPIAVLFNLRDNDWDRWFTLLEGRDTVIFRRRISRFTPGQLNAALGRYSRSYDYTLAGDLPPSAQEVLALPLNVRILSESRQYDGEISAEEAFDEHLLAGYLRRRGESVLRLLPWLTADELAEGLTALAMELVAQRDGTLDPSQALLVFQYATAAERDDAASALRALLDERILTKDTHGVRFGYPALQEYLLAAASVHSVSRFGRIDSLERLTSAVAGSSRSLSAAVRSNVERIVRTERPEAQELVREHYSTSGAYIGGRLQDLRSALGHGSRTSTQDLNSIYGSLGRLSPPDAWDAFFVVAARPNRQSADQLVDTFAAAWDANHERPDRWKLLDKIMQRGLLFRDAVVTRVLASRQPTDWEMFLASVADDEHRAERFAGVTAIADRPIGDLMGDGPEWEHARSLLDLLIEGRPYVVGEVYEAAPNLRRRH